MKQIIYAVDNKSSGFKSILTKIMKLLNDQFAEHLVEVFNLSLKRGVFPDSLKIAKVIRKISNYIWNYWLENWKKKTGCWSRFKVIWDFFIEIKYYAIQNIWKEIGKLNFVVIDVDLAHKGIA